MIDPSRRNPDRHQTITALPCRVRVTAWLQLPPTTEAGVGFDAIHEIGIGGHFFGARRRMGR